MLYLNKNSLLDSGINWNETVEQIDKVVHCLAQMDFAQPLKPYLRYRNPVNRIIAMPAFIGGKFNISGIKWIASFPGNIKKDIPRAHSVVVLNNADTGEPAAIINTALLSIIRTASVSGLMIKYFLQNRKMNMLNVGIIGFGPIGQYHLKMCQRLLKDKIQKFYIYDLRPVRKESIEEEVAAKVEICNSWPDVFRKSAIFITCTVSDHRYINLKPVPGGLYLNVSLRDFHPDMLQYFRHSTVVDNWEEVCRENTDIEAMHKEKGLQEEDVKEITDVVTGNCMAEYTQDTPVFFNPMGMGVFDIALGKYYFELAVEKGKGQFLE